MSIFMHDARRVSGLVGLIMRKVSRKLRTYGILKPLENVMIPQKFFVLFRFPTQYIVLSVKNAVVWFETL